MFEEVARPAIGFFERYLTFWVAACIVWQLRRGSGIVIERQTWLRTIKSRRSMTC